MKLYRILFWGIKDEYPPFEVHFLEGRMGGKIEIVGFVNEFLSRYTGKIDGIPFINKGDISTIDFDYLVITTPTYLKEIFFEATTKMGINEEKIIGLNVFSYRGSILRSIANYANRKFLLYPLIVLLDFCIIE